VVVVDVVHVVHAHSAIKSSVAGFTHPLQMNDFATFNMLPFIPLR